MPIKKKPEKTNQIKFWVVSAASLSIEDSCNYLSFQEAKDSADEDEIIRECIVTKKFVMKGWEEEK